MRAEVLQSLICCILFSELNIIKNVNGNQIKNVKDYSAVSVNEFATLFKDSPYAVYASAVPHGAYSFHAPSFQLPSKPAANMVPVRNENIVIHKQSGYLTDSYGNKYVQTPQSVAYKTTLPQEYVALQDLPAHLAQPFAPGYQFKQGWPQIAYGGSINVPQTFQPRDAPPLFKFANGQSFPLAYAEKAALYTTPVQGKFNFPTQVNVAEQSTNQKIVYSSTESYKPVTTLEIGPSKYQKAASKTNPTAPTQVKVTTVKEGKKSVFTIPTKPSVPNLLDVSLLEPLVFANPVVPQVQHYLPKINLEPFIHTSPIQAKKQHKEYLVQNTKYYDGPIKIEQSTAKYDKNKEKPHVNPSNEFKPIIPKEKYHHSNEQQHHEEENDDRHHVTTEHKPAYDAESSNESSDEEDEDEPKQLIYHGNLDEEENQSTYQSEDDDQNYKEHRQNKETHQDQKQHPVTPKTHSKEKHYPHHHDSHNQQHHDSHNQQHHEERSKPKNHPEKHYTKESAPKSHPKYKTATQVTISPHKAPIQAHWEPKAPVYKIVKNPHTSSTPTHVEGKSKRIIVKEETPVQTKMLREQMMTEVIKEEDNDEEEFDKAYKQAAFGFPAYNHDDNHEKDIYNPATYGAAKYQEAYDLSNSPFEQYFPGNDDFPRSSRLTYKEMRDQNTDNYFKDFIAKQPKRLGELKQTKNDYFKSYKDNKSPNYFTNVKHQKSRPEAVFGHQKNNDNGKWLAQYKAKPAHYEFDYSKTGNPRDNFAHASKPSAYRNKWKTQFVEPQFQYGFEPIPKLFESELAAMASNISPESEEPGSRKKIYKENWYIHKTSSTGKS